MRMSLVPWIACGVLAAGAGRAGAEPVWTDGKALVEVIGYDLQAHDGNGRLTEYQTNAVCLLLGYLRGFTESAALASHYDATALPFFLPENITNDQIERIVYKYLTDNPDKLRLSGGVLLVAALSKEFPNPTFKPPHPVAGDAVPVGSGAFDKLSKAVLTGS